MAEVEDGSPAFHLRSDVAVSRKPRRGGDLGGLACIAARFRLLIASAFGGIVGARAGLAFAVEGRGCDRLNRPLGKRRQSQLLRREVDVDQIGAEDIRADQAVFVYDGRPIANGDYTICKLQFADSNVIGYCHISTLQTLIADSGKTDVGDARQASFLRAFTTDEDSAGAGIQQQAAVAVVQFNRQTIADDVSRVA